MPGPDARHLVGIRGDEAGATRAPGNRRESGPADAGAPERCDPPIEHHRRSVAGAIEIDGLKILVLLQSEAVEQIARQDRKAGALRAEGDRVAFEIANGLVPVSYTHLRAHETRHE